MTSLSVFSKNFFKLGNMSIDMPKAKSGLMLRYKVARGAFREYI